MIGGLSRADAGYFSRWWWTVDRSVIVASLALMGLGFMLVFAAGPAAAERIGLPNAWHFVFRQAVFLVPAAMALTFFALLPATQARRAAILIFFAALALMVVGLISGDETKGAQRWVDLGPFNIQPSEFAKPGLVVLSAWLLSESLREPGVPGRALALAAFGTMAFLLLKQPDYGQFLLTSAAFGATFFVAGLSWAWVAAITMFAAGMVGSAYLFVPHVAKRIDAFIAPESADTYQIDAARAAIERGGLFGAGPGEGIVKHRLPDAHTDFVFAVLGEEYGLMGCAALVGVYAFISLRALRAASQRGSVFQQSAVTGLAVLIGAQAFINMGVAINLLPAKGMTLPYLSYGGSSLLATSLTLGLILALGRDQGPARRRADVMA